MGKNNLIVLSDHYLTFVKDQVEYVSDIFSHVRILKNTLALIFTLIRSI